jgi:hypothetical protein
MAADIFALGCTMYEAASGCELPKNGPEWQALRNGDVPTLERYSPLFNELLAAMLHANAEARPDIMMVVGHPAAQPMVPEGEDDVMSMRKQLHAARARNLVITRYVADRLIGCIRVPFPVALTKSVCRILKSDPSSNNSSNSSSPDRRGRLGRKGSCSW